MVGDFNNWKKQAQKVLKLPKVTHSNPSSLSLMLSHDIKSHLALLEVSREETNIPSPFLEVFSNLNLFREELMPRAGLLQNKGQVSSSLNILIP